MQFFFNEQKCYGNIKNIYSVQDKDFLKIQKFKVSESGLIKSKKNLVGELKYFDEYFLCYEILSETIIITRDKLISKCLVFQMNLKHKLLHILTPCVSVEHD